MTNRADLPERGEVLTLQKLIMRRKDETGWAYSEFARRSDDQPSKARWGQLAKGRRLVKFPEIPTLRRMAEVLAVDEDTVVLAAAASLGMDVGRHRVPLLTLMPPGVDLLTDETVLAILSVIRAAVARERQIDVALANCPDRDSAVLGATADALKMGRWSETGTPRAASGLSRADESAK